MSIEAPEAFFPLLDSLADLQSASNYDHSASSSDADVFQNCLDLLTKVHKLSSSTISNVKLSLALKEASPLIETHYQLFSHHLANWAHGNQDVANNLWYITSSGEVDVLRSEIKASLPAGAIGHSVG